MDFFQEYEIKKRVDLRIKQLNRKGGWVKVVYNRVDYLDITHGDFFFGQLNQSEKEFGSPANNPEKPADDETN